jgi:hypothetical protein
MLIDCGRTMDNQAGLLLELSGHHADPNAMYHRNLAEYDLLASDLTVDRRCLGAKPTEGFDFFCNLRLISILAERSHRVSTLCSIALTRSRAGTAAHV